MKLLKFSKENCPACMKVEMLLKSSEIEDYEEVNPFENPNLAVNYQIQSVPVTILLDDNGKEVQRSIGFKPDELEEIVSKLA
ncbi:thioredoxin [Bacillus sp. S13(2024)]|uniref:thioredoxin n=1 Tax=Bacillus sp. S13(2024) TaxID=3162885 RepID=UPI003D1FE62C